MLVSYCGIYSLVSGDHFNLIFHSAVLYHAAGFLLHAQHLVMGGDAVEVILVTLVAIGSCCTKAQGKQTIVTRSVLHSLATSLLMRNMCTS